MSLKTISFQSKRELYLVGCETVGLCLGSGWAARTANGSSLIKATVLNSGRPLGRETDDYINVRGNAVYQYSFEVNSTAFASHSPPWIDSLGCADIVDVFPFPCVVDSIWSAAATGTGAQGAQGATGATGAQGAAGAQGPQGA